MKNTDYNNIMSLKSQFLIAMPELADPAFFHTVSVVCEHSPQGAMAIIVNRLHPELTVKIICEKLKMDYSQKASQIPVYMGGPVDPGQIFIIHNKPFNWKSTFPLSPSIAVTNSIDVLKQIALGKGPSKYLIAIGCAAWSSGQLEMEIMKNVWLNAPLSENILFNEQVEERWELANNSLGVNPGFLSNTIGHA